MQILSANSGKSGFGRLMDIARTEAMAAAVTKHGETVVVDDCERLKVLGAAAP